MHTYVYLLILLHAAFLNLSRSRFWYVLVHKQLEVGVIFTVFVQVLDFPKVAINKLINCL